MRSITLKLTLAFLVVGLIGALLVSVFVSVRTQREFDQFISERYQKDLIDQLGQYYEKQGSWQGLSAINLRLVNGDGSNSYMRAPLVLVDKNHVVMMGSRRYHVGNRVNENDLQGALQIKVNGEVVGSVVLDLSDDAGNHMDAPEGALLQRIKGAIGWGALGASVIALALGILLASAISRPVKELTEATQRVAQGELGLQVPVRTRDELGDLAGSFNRMSADLATSNHLRRQMTADVAHELRTPLSVILGYTEALSDGKLQGKPAIYDAMYGEAQLLNHLVDDLRTLSLADAGELSLNRGLVPPGELVERIAASHSELAAQRGIRLDTEVAPDLPLVSVDRERMVQVLANLVSNALRYTPNGGVITLSARAAGPSVALRVQDTGPGIAPEHLPFIFKRFYRADDSRPSNGESGLGLAIVRSLVEAHGGSIEVESEPGKGAAFIVTLPAAS